MNVNRAIFFMLAVSGPALAQGSDCSTEKPAIVRVLHTGKITWNGVPITRLEMQKRITQAAHQKPMPNIKVAGDKTARFEDIAEVFKVMQETGFHCPKVVGFITEPAH